MRNIDLKIAPIRQGLSADPPSRSVPDRKIGKSTKIRKSASIFNRLSNHEYWELWVEIETRKSSELKLLVFKTFVLVPRQHSGGCLTTSWWSAQIRKSERKIVTEAFDCLIPVSYVHESFRRTPIDYREPLVYWNETVKPVLEVDFAPNEIQNFGIIGYQ